MAGPQGLWRGVKGFDWIGLRDIGFRVKVAFGQQGLQAGSAQDLHISVVVGDGKGR